MRRIKLEEWEWRDPFERDVKIQRTVEAVIADVRTGGDDALRSLSERFDGTRIDSVGVDKKEIERAYTLTIGLEIQPDAIPFEIIASDSTICLNDETSSLDETKRRIITEALAFTKGRELAAAKILGIEQSKLKRLTEELDISLS